MLTSQGEESLQVAVGQINLLDVTMDDVSVQSELAPLGRAAKRMLVASSTENGMLSSRIYVHEEKRLTNIQFDNISTPAFFTRLAVLRSGEDDTLRVIGLTDNGKLYLNGQLLAKDATSFSVTDHNIVWTNATHEARFLPIEATAFNENNSLSLLESEPVSLGRRVERGSRIVTAVPSTMSLVLQMPRGNLETIAPRPLVLEVIKRNLDQKKYGSAFRICRTHRLDMNLLVDYNRTQFFWPALPSLSSKSETSST